MKPAARSMLDLARSRSASTEKSTFADSGTHVAQYLPAPAQICGRTLSWRRKKDSVGYVCSLDPVRLRYWLMCITSTARSKLGLCDTPKRGSPKLNDYLAILTMLWVRVRRGLT